MASAPGDKHYLYDKHSNQIARVKDVFEGIDTAKRYLQQYNQEDDPDYRDRMNIATLDNFVFRTVDDMKNIIFRKPLDESGITNNEIKTYLKTIDFTNNINEFSKLILTNRIRDGHTFILVDSVSYDPEKVKTKAEQDALNIRPYFVNILRENILSWKKDKFGKYIMIVIKETYEVEDDYSVDTKEQIKIWKNDGTVEIWRDGEKFGEVIETNLKEIPIVKVGDDNIPPLYDLAKINITHMNRDSEVSNYSRVGGAAFLAVFGDLDDGDAPKTLGINKGLKFRDKTTSDVKWIEMEGTNYEMLKDRILYHEDQMDRISVSFTTEQSNKTATQVNKESMVGESKATDYATELEDSINLAISLLNIYKTDGQASTDNLIEVNKDFDSSILTPEMVVSYRLDYTSGIISYEKLIEYLVAGEYFKEMTKQEMNEEKTRLMNNPMSGEDL